MNGARGPVAGPLFVVFAAVLFSGGASPDSLPVSALCIEAGTGRVLAEENADLRRPPASMVKMMQMLLVSEGLRSGRWTSDTPITATGHARRMGGTQVFLREGEVRTLGELMQAVAVASANDAAMAVAEGLWGSEEVYLAEVNERARNLGMNDSEFHSVHGLPPDRGEEPDRTTARDMALLARRCVRDPQILAWTRQTKVRFRPGEPYYPSTNKLLEGMDDCDGLKTGYIRAAGFCITATAEREGLRLIAVVMGHRNSKGRFRLAEKLLEEGFAAARP